MGRTLILSNFALLSSSGSFKGLQRIHLTNGVCCILQYSYSGEEKSWSNTNSSSRIRYFLSDFRFSPCFYGSMISLMTVFGMFLWIICIVRLRKQMWRNSSYECLANLWAQVRKGPVEQIIHQLPLIITAFSLSYDFLSLSCSLPICKKIISQYTYSVPLVN